MEDQEVIRGQMEETREALGDKLEALEEKVTTTVQDATEEVAQTVEKVTDNVQETVETVKETVVDTVAAVREGVTAFKEIFNLPRHVDRYPWLAVGGSLTFGFIFGEFVWSSRNGHPHAAIPTPGSAPSPAAYVSETHEGEGNGNGKPKESALHNLLAPLEPELNKLKGLAIGALMGTVREMVTKAAGNNLGQPLREIIDSMTEKLGGTLVDITSTEEEEHPAATV